MTEKLSHYVDLQDVMDKHKLVLDIRPTADELVNLAKRCEILDAKNFTAFS